MTNADLIDECINIVKAECDPRGHPVLEAIREAWHADAAQLRTFDDVRAMVQAMVDENESHSRNAESRLGVNPRLRIVP